MKNIYVVILCCAMALFAAGCQNSVRHVPDKDIIILFENDVHCAIDGYAQFSALKQALSPLTPYVAVVSAGDFAQGAAIGSLTQGESIIRIMNAVGYDAVTIGNHEFDYGVPQQRHLMRELKADVVCCNFTDIHDHLIYLPFIIKEYGPVKVAFVGVATPTTFTSSTPTNFEDANGKLIYSFHADDTFELVQKAADKARRKGADYVVVLSHLGDDTALDNSVDLIQSTTGIDAVLDGHQHHILNLKIANAKGDSVILASTGTQFQRLGKLTINTEGKMSVDLISGESFTVADKKIDKVIAEIRQEMQTRVGQIVGHSEVPLTMLKNGKREVRRGETNLADVLTDAFRFVTEADIAIMNGGGIRNQIDAGRITYGDIYSVIPFNNTIRKLECTGQQLLDALEVGVALAPEENGDFFQVSGMRYTYRTDVPTSVILDKNQLFVGVGDTRRIVSAEVEKNGKWVPLDPKETYTIGGQSYILVSKGAAGALQYMHEIECENMGDVEAVIRYFQHVGNISAAQYGKAQGRVKMLK